MKKPKTIILRSIRWVVQDSRLETEWNKIHNATYDEGRIALRRFKIYPDKTCIYFSTSTITEWQCVFKEEKYFQIVIESLNYCSKHKGLHLVSYIIMPNHLHLITANDERTNLSALMRDFKHYTSALISEELQLDNERLILYVFRKSAEKESKKQKYKVWQEGFHPEAIFTEDFLFQKMEYIHNNPVRKGFVEKAEDWKYCSARNWILNDDSIIRIEKEYLFDQGQEALSHFPSRDGIPERTGK